jgi:hypothetical protein
VTKRERRIPGAFSKKGRIPQALKSEFLQAPNVEAEPRPAKRGRTLECPEA